METKKITQASELEIGKYYRDGNSYYYVTGRTEAPQGSFLNAISFTWDYDMSLDVSTPYIEEIVKDGSFEEINRDLFMNAFEHFKEEKQKLMILDIERLALANLKLKNITL
ncbi:hypothetical protein [Riemerella columbipharyngis]|uniref:Uncharacterized protein n=1 Tax=Riemerella columbipharyngis TaxID=1071918 RepID=A0A1G7FBN6_9FLAO|nr:hypothetical protein [Riemerella columbipharyngis]SDE73254.1 hypothetical protein SAMN05421544_12124 [Riemerella columbipharyngis]